MCKKQLVTISMLLCTLIACFAEAQPATNDQIAEQSKEDGSTESVPVDPLLEKQSTELVELAVQPESVITAMQEVHGAFSGQQGYVAQFGDSITHSMAFWSPIGWDNPDRFLTEDDGLAKKPTNGRWRDYVKGTRSKGAEHGNGSGWKAGRLLEAVGPVLERDRPEVAIIMIGTNDISSGKVPQQYRQQLEAIIKKCLAAHCVPILNTVPPRRGRDQAVRDLNRIVRDVAKEQSIPLVDYHAACLRLRPEGTWDGTVLSADGVHPSAGKTNDYSVGNLRQCGYALRNWMNFLVLRQVYHRVLAKE